ncbi:MAG: hypothetical protein PHT79_03090 [Syntrophomonadaceae bacterium]|nr:hypothetical protein [Syntrophomonadaceae bacterium]MDD3888486.1 hypothetical protein [Syntrophomonadaceae bacterium]MDD4548726.1 hypothetical protein [Syntrophomonadaceae bacterium]
MNIIIKEQGITFAGKVKELPGILALFPEKMTLKELLQEIEIIQVKPCNTSNQIYLS